MSACGVRARTRVVPCLVVALAVLAARPAAAQRLTMRGLVTWPHGDGFVRLGGVQARLQPAATPWAISGSYRSGSHIFGKLVCGVDACTLPTRSSYAVTTLALGYRLSAGHSRWRVEATPGVGALWIGNSRRSVIPSGDPNAGQWADRTATTNAVLFLVDGDAALHWRPRATSAFWLGIGAQELYTAGPGATCASCGDASYGGGFWATSAFLELSYELP